MVPDDYRPTIDDVHNEIVQFVTAGHYTHARDLIDRLLEAHSGSDWPPDVLIALRRRGGEVQEPITFRRGKE